MNEEELAVLKDICDVLTRIETDLSNIADLMLAIKNKG